MCRNIYLFFIISFLSAFAHRSKAQTVIEGFSSEDFFNIETWWIKPFDQDYKFSLFNLNTAEHNYHTNETVLMSYSIVSYTWHKGFGPAIGTRLLKDRLVALGGPQYTYYSEKFFVTTNFTSEFRSNPDFELFSIIQFRPQITQEIDGFLQGQFSFTFNAHGHLLSFQYVRFGVDMGIVQTGLAFNQFQFGRDWGYSFQPGLFLRLEFQ